LMLKPRPWRIFATKSCWEGWSLQSSYP
jgi:hypothetical protein